MKHKTKRLLPLAAVACSALFALAGCGGSSFEVELGWSDGTVAAEGTTVAQREYDESLFYRNDVTLRQVADPTVIWVEGEDGGTLYLYGTSNTLSTRAIGVWQSTDGIHWDAAGVAFEPDEHSWGYASLWAPEVVYHEESGLYYMTYSARNSNTIASGGPYYANTYIGLAYSESPLGPFVQWTGENANGDTIGLGDPIFDPAKITALDGTPCEEGTYGRLRFLDSFYFVDEDDEIYLYLTRGQDRYQILEQDAELAAQFDHDQSEIWVVKCTDFASPDYSTVTRLTRVGYAGVTGEETNDIDAERAASDAINEGPQVVRRGDNYYLVYSVGSTSSNLYSVAQAVGTSPMGPFTKLSKADGGLVLGAEMNWIQNAGTGHCCLTEIGDELFIFYHEGADRYTIDQNNRAVSYVRAGFLQNGQGLDVLVANGPTSYSLQALPEAISGYKNIAPEAQVEVQGMAQGSSAAYLTDGFFASHSYGVIGETEFSADETAQITLTFGDWRSVRAVMLYNSIDYNKTFYQIARISLEVRTPGGAQGTAYVSGAAFSFDDATCYASQQLMFAGSNLVVAFAEVEVRSITITFRVPTGRETAAIGDIWVLGK